MKILSSRAVRVLIVDDHPVVRAGLASMLSTRPEIELADAAPNGEAALEALRRSPVDVMLLDLRMARVSGMDVLRECARMGLRTRAIVLTSYVTHEEVYRAMQAGAWGYLSKETGLDQMVQAICAVHAGQRYLRGHIAECLAERMSQEHLTGREAEILQMVANGLTNKQIGRSLNISNLTVKNHVNNILVKLEVSDRTEASTVAIRRGIIHLDPG